MIFPINDELIDYIWHSNRIDCNTFDPGDLTRSIVEHCYAGSTENIEVSDHMNALATVIVETKLNTPISLTKMALKIHKILGEHIMDKPGTFRTYGVTVGGHSTVPHKYIPKYMKRLDAMLADAKTAEDAWAIHDYFECCHPFGDGNGRSGRLLMNYVRLRLGLPLLIVTYGRDGDQYKYYRKIQEYRDNKFKLL
jgi:Fic family protein